MESKCAEVLNSSYSPVAATLAVLGMITENFLWKDDVLLAGKEEFKISSDYWGRYARLIMQQEPDLAGMFETRELTSLQEYTTAEPSMKAAVLLARTARGELVHTTPHLTNP